MKGRVFMKKRKMIIVLIIFLIILFGLATRTSFAYQIMPAFLTKGVGDALWATMFYLIFRFLCPSLSIGKLSFITIMFSWIIECSQLLQWSWLMTLRETPLRYVLGQGFHMEDLFWYVLGVLFGVVIDIVIEKKLQHRIEGENR